MVFVNLGCVDDAWSLTVNTWNRFACAGAFAHAALVGLALAVVRVTPSVFDAGSPTFVTPFGVVCYWAYTSVAPWSAVAVSNDMVLVT